MEQVFFRALYKIFHLGYLLFCTLGIPFLREVLSIWSRRRRKILFLLKIIYCTSDIFFVSVFAVDAPAWRIEIKIKHDTITHNKEIQYNLFIIPYPRSFKISFILDICSNNSFSRFCSIATTWAGALAAKFLFSSLRRTTIK